MRPPPTPPPLDVATQVLVTVLVLVPNFLSVGGCTWLLLRVHRLSKDKQKRLFFRQLWYLAWCNILWALCHFLLWLTTIRGRVGHNGFFMLVHTVCGPAIQLMDYVGALIETHIALGVLFVNLRWGKALRVARRTLRWVAFFALALLIVEDCLILAKVKERRQSGEPPGHFGLLSFQQKTDVAGAILLIGGFVVSIMAYATSFCCSVGRVHLKIGHQMSFYIMNYIISFSPLICVMCFHSLGTSSFAWTVVISRSLNGFLNTLTYLLQSKQTARQSRNMESTAGESHRREPRDELCATASFHVAFGGAEIVNVASEDFTSEDERTATLIDKAGYMAEFVDCEAQEAIRLAERPGPEENAIRMNRIRLERIAALVNAADWARLPAGRVTGQPPAVLAVHYLRQFCRYPAFCGLFIIDMVLITFILVSFSWPIVGVPPPPIPS